MSVIIFPMLTFSNKIVGQLTQIEPTFLQKNFYFVVQKEICNPFFSSGVSLLPFTFLLGSLFKGAYFSRHILAGHLSVL